MECQGRWGYHTSIPGAAPRLHGETARGAVGPRSHRLWQVDSLLRLPVQKATPQLAWTVARRQRPQVFPSSLPTRRWWDGMGWDGMGRNMARIAHPRVLPTRWPQAPPRLGLAGYVRWWSAVTASLAGVGDCTHKAVGGAAATHGPAAQKFSLFQDFLLYKIFKLGLKNSSRDFQLNYIISLFFYLHLMFHACV